MKREKKNPPKKGCAILIFVLFAIGVIGVLATSGDPGEKKATKEEGQAAEKITMADCAGTYEISRVDIKKGILGDWVGSSPEAEGMVGDYVILDEDGHFNAVFAGVGFNTTYSVGMETTVHYSGQDNYPAVELKLDNDSVGSLNVEAYIVAGYPYIILGTQTDDGLLQAGCYFVFEAE